jgi:hypothetical protein
VSAEAGTASTRELVKRRNRKARARFMGSPFSAVPTIL